MKQKSAFERFLETAEKTADITLRWYYQKQDIMKSLLTDKELDIIADKVLSRISITIDADEVIQKIKELNDELNKLKGIK